MVTSGASAEETLAHLESYGIEWYLTEKGDLLVRYWQVGAEDFIPVERVAKIRTGRAVPKDMDALEWVSQHLPELRRQYPGQWIAVIDGHVAAAAISLSELLQHIQEKAIQHPFVTQVPERSLIWNTAYAGQTI